MDKPLVPWLVLHHLPGMMPRHARALLQVFGTPLSILTADTAVFRKAALPDSIIDGIEDYQHRGRASKVWDRVEKTMDWRDDTGHAITCPDSNDYPEPLRHIPDPPGLLFVKGRAECLHRRAVALVGSRKPSAGGRRLAGRLAAELTGAGLSIVSGMALGIDGESHIGALDAGGSTLAVLGTGVDRVYPRRHRELSRRIAENGALVSEFPLGSDPLPWHFPLRNRIISGLSLGIVIVEATVKSGSLITARAALEQGREVFAVPGSVDNPQARGCHYLIRQGATLVESADDILKELQIEPGRAMDSGAPQPRYPAKGKASRVLKEIGYDAVGIDHLICRTGMDVSEVTALLSELEISGHIIGVSGGFTRAPA